MKSTEDKKHTNRLAGEKSPYLLQHAHNPVNWYPWGAEALTRAKEEDKPIIVSIGYSACHWCHVMERECFEDEEAAAMMNENFICIKVDREERPDVDSVYMNALHAMGMQGGWPLNVFLTPGANPFYGGTYFPKAKWIQVLQSITKAFAEQRNELEESGENFRKHLNTNPTEKYDMQPAETLPGGTEFWNDAINRLADNFDPQYGGFDKAPKFPMPAVYDLLLHIGTKHSNSKAYDHALLTLDRMALGGIYDPLAGGFARYSTDKEWHIPHFEKMLYDNGQLLSLYARAYAATGKLLYRQTAQGIIEFVKNELTDEQDGFYAALDADSEGVEGKFYVWTYEEWNEVLSGEEAKIAAEYYYVTPEGNWEHGLNTLFRRENDEEFISKTGLSLSPEQLREMLAGVHEKLLSRRSTRVRPGLDNKIITSWNALMIEGLCDAAVAFDDPAAMEMAVKAAVFILHRNTEAGTYVRSGSPGSRFIEAFLDDYALLAAAFLKLNTVTGEVVWLEEATKLTEVALAEFYDPEEGFFFYTSKEGEQLIAGQKEIFDNVIPSSNAVMCGNLLKLGTLTDNPDYTEKALTMLHKVAGQLSTDLSYMSKWGKVLLELNTSPVVAAITGHDAGKVGRRLLQKAGDLRFEIVSGTVESFASPLLRGKFVEGKTVIHVCIEGTCLLPSETVEEALEKIRQLSGKPLV